MQPCVGVKGISPLHILPSFNIINGAAIDYMHCLLEGIGIIQDVENHHGKVYIIEQIRVWAHMIQMKQRISYDDPLDKPFFCYSERLKDKSSESEETMSTLLVQSSACYLNCSSNS